MKIQVCSLQYLCQQHIVIFYSVQCGTSAVEYLSVKQNRKNKKLKVSLPIP